MNKGFSIFSLVGLTGLIVGRNEQTIKTKWHSTNVNITASRTALPSDIRNSSLVPVFENKLKTFLFKNAFQ